ncbi:MAG: hypothetical protein OEY27_01060 [Gammaproteobacteria bacterium]|nr:hypothetical protein [Gammaproteobacteria bacterium]
MMALLFWAWHQSERSFIRDQARPKYQANTRTNCVENIQYNQNNRKAPFQHWLVETNTFFWTKPLPGAKNISSGTLRAKDRLGSPSQMICSPESYRQSGITRLSSRNPCSAGLAAIMVFVIETEFTEHYRDRKKS